MNEKRGAGRCQSTKGKMQNADWRAVNEEPRTRNQELETKS